MKTLVEKWTPLKESSFSIKRYKIAWEEKDVKELVMRQHDEFEITVLTGGSGKRIIGNTVNNFSKGDTFMIGPGMPHCIQLDEAEEVVGFTIHFLINAFGKGFFDLPENKKILELLRDAHFGITFTEAIHGQFWNKLKALTNLKSFERMLNFFSLLDELSLVSGRKLISSHSYSEMGSNKNYVLVNKTYEFILSEFGKKDISLDEISSHVNMSASTFCRFFKKHFHKTYTQFLNEVRIGHACKLLRNSNWNIAQIGFSSGYNHLTHFNKQFKKITGYSPKEYRQLMC